MPQLINIFPKKIDRLVEPFCGGGSVFLNTPASSYLANDNNKWMIKLHEFLVKEAKNREKFFKRIFALIKEYGFSASYLGIYAPEELKKKREELKKKHEELLEALKKIKLDAGQFFNIEEHEFWKIITNLFRKPNGLMLPSEQNIPIICQKHEDRDMESLVKEWNTNLRYSTEDDNNTWNKISLNPERLKTLMDLCVEIKNHPCYKF